MYNGTRDIPRLRSRFLCRIDLTKISTAFCQAKNKAYRDCSAKSQYALFYFRTNGSIAHKSQKDEVKVGVMGFSEKASAELGKRFVKK